MINEILLFLFLSGIAIGDYYIVREMFERHYDEFMKFIKKRLYDCNVVDIDNSAGDILHDSFVKLEKEEETIRKIDDVKSMRAYFYVVIKHRIYDYLSSTNKDLSRMIFYENCGDSDLFLEFEDNTYNGEKVLIDKEELDVQWACIRALSDSDREMFFLRYELEYSPEKICKVLNISRSTYAARFNRANKRLAIEKEKRGLK